MSKIPRFDTATLYGNIKKDDSKLREARKLRLMSIALKKAYVGEYRVSDGVKWEDYYTDYAMNFVVELAGRDTLLPGFRDIMDQFQEVVEHGWHHYWDAALGVAEEGRRLRLDKGLTGLPAMRDWTAEELAYMFYDFNLAFCLPINNVVTETVEGAETGLEYMRKTLPYSPKRDVCLTVFRMMLTTPDNILNSTYDSIVSPRVFGPDDFYMERGDAVFYRIPFYFTPSVSRYFRAVGESKRQAFATVFWLQLERVWNDHQQAGYEMGDDYFLNRLDSFAAGIPTLSYVKRSR